MEERKYLVQAIRNGPNKTTVRSTWALSNLQQLQAIRSVAALFNTVEGGSTLVDTEGAGGAGLNRSGRGDGEEGGEREDDGGELHFDSCWKRLRGSD